MSRHEDTPTFTHDCDRCRFLGRTLGGMRRFDLYYHPNVDEGRAGTLVARYSSDGPDYLSCPEGYASPNGHAELFVAQYLVSKGDF